MFATPGIGSGIDIDALVDAMVNAERAPKLAALERQESNSVNKISALGRFSSAIASFRDTVSSLNDGDLYTSRITSSSHNSILSVSADETAPEGDYEMVVEQLAESQKIASNAFSDASDVVGEGTLTLALGSDSFSIDLDSSNNTLEQIRDEINNASDNPGISASIVNDQDGAKLVLSSDKTGADNTISVLASGDSDGDDFDNAGLSRLTYDPDNTAGQASAVVYGTELNAAADARITIDSLTINSDSNTITSAIEGVSLTLNKADLEQTVDVSISRDYSGVEQKTKSFSSAYNALIEEINVLTVYNQEADFAAELVGDSSVRSFLSTMRKEISSFDDSQELGALSSLGITTNKEGKLDVDSSVLSDQIENNFDNLSDFFTGDSGLMGRIEELAESYVSSSGSLTQRISNLTQSVKDIDDQRAALDLRIEKVENNFRARFIAMDSIVAQFNSTSNFLEGALANLPGFTRQSK